MNSRVQKKLAYLVRFAEQNKQGTRPISINTSRTRSLEITPLSQYIRIELARSSTECDHIAILEILLHNHCNINYAEVVKYYVEKKYIRCLKMLSMTSGQVRSLIAICGWHYGNEAVVQLAGPFSIEQILSSPYNFTTEYDAIIICQSIICNMPLCKFSWIKYEEPQSLEQLIPNVPPCQYEMLIQLSIMHINQYTCQLIEYVIRNTDVSSLAWTEKYSLKSTITIWQDVVYEKESFSLSDLGKLIRGIPRKQHKLLIRLSIMHKHQYTSSLIQILMTDDDCSRLLLLNVFLTTTNLDVDVRQRILFMFTALLY